MKFGFGTILKSVYGTRYLVAMVANNKAALINMKLGTRWDNAIDCEGYASQFNVHDFVTNDRFKHFEIFKLGSDR